MSVFFFPRSPEKNASAPSRIEAPIDGGESIFFSLLKYAIFEHNVRKFLFSKFSLSVISHKKNASLEKNAPIPFSAGAISIGKALFY